MERGKAFFPAVILIAENEAMETKPAVQRAAVESCLASATSRRILSLCIRKAQTVKDLSRDADIPMATAYRQVKGLVDSGVLVVERSAMTADGKPYDLYRSRIRLARLEVRPDQVDVAWEINAGIGDRLVNLWDQLGR